MVEHCSQFVEGVGGPAAEWVEDFLFSLEGEDFAFVGTAAVELVGVDCEVFAEGGGGEEEGEDVVEEEAAGLVVLEAGQGADGQDADSVALIWRKRQGQRAVCEPFLSGVAAFVEQH